MGWNENKFKNHRFWDWLEKRLEYEMQILELNEDQKLKLQIWILCRKKHGFQNGLEQRLALELYILRLKCRFWGFNRFHRGEVVYLKICKCEEGLQQGSGCNEGLIGMRVCLWCSC